MLYVVLGLSYARCCVGFEPLLPAVQNGAVNACDCGGHDALHVCCACMPDLALEDVCRCHMHQVLSCVTCAVATPTLQAGSVWRVYSCVLVWPTLCPGRTESLLQAEVYLRQNSDFRSGNLDHPVAFRASAFSFFTFLPHTVWMKHKPHMVASCCTFSRHRSQPWIRFIVGTPHAPDHCCQTFQPREPSWLVTFQYGRHGLAGQNT
jgi:hypothetical protein